MQWNAIAGESALLWFMVEEWIAGVLFGKGDQLEGQYQMKECLGLRVGRRVGRRTGHFLEPLSQMPEPA